jgi:hypothetical protein
MDVNANERVRKYGSVHPSAFIFFQILIVISLTAPILLTQIREPPNIPQSD